MNFSTFPRNRFAFLKLPAFCLLVSLAFSLTMVWNVGQAQQTKLSLSDILIALRSKKVTLAERNQIVTEAVKKRGITFALTLEIEKELQSVGADAVLIAAIRQQSPTADPTPTPATTPTPAPTPRAPDWQAFQNLGNSFFVKGDFSAAIVNYSKVIELNGKDASPYLGRGLALYNQRNYDSAIADFNKAIELNPKDSTAYFKRGDAFEKLGKVQNAIDDYQKAVDLESGNEIAKTSLQRLQAQQTKALEAPPKPVVAASNDDSSNAEKSDSANDFVEVGSLKEVAVKLAVPLYPSYERQRRTEGVVTVIVTLDENGKVIKAEATSGPKTLRQFAEDAAKKSKFNPAKVNEKPVKARGYVAYNFKAS